MRDHVLEAEEKRIDRWHATYNAALTGLWVRYGLTDRGDRENHDLAMQAADRAHGPLERTDG